MTLNKLEWLAKFLVSELKILQVAQPYVDQGYSQLHLLVGRVSILKVYR